jgi:hypothetical protein
MKRTKDFDIIITTILTGLILILIAMSSNAKQGAKQGLSLCENIIIPSLLPILILTNIIIKSRASKIFESLFGKLFEKIFKLPRCTATAVIFGLIAGYPSGTILTSQLYNQKLIDSKTAERIMYFNFSGGIAFTITAVGTICFGSTKIGIILYIINIISELIICIVSSFFYKSTVDEKSNNVKLLSFTDAMIQATETTVKSIAVMCAYITLFSAITNIFSLPEYITPLIEITNGICNAKSLSLPVFATFLSFGGFCIHFQLIGMLNEMKVSYFKFLFGRICSSAISFILAKLYLAIFPESANVFSNISAPINSSLTQINTGLSLVMIIGCAVAIFDIEGKKLKLH